MANKTIDELYSQGRRFPDGKHTAQEPAPANTTESRYHVEKHPAPKPIWDRPAQPPQMPEDMHDTAYDNDVSHSWITGKDEDATTKTAFDRGNSWRQPRGNPKLRED